MPVPSVPKNQTNLQARPRDPVAAVHQSIAELDKALGPLGEYQAELREKPRPQFATALIEAIKAKHPGVGLTPEELEIASHTWRCTKCDAVHVSPCGCNASLIPAGVRFFAERPHLLKQFKPIKPAGPDVTEIPADVTKNGSPVSQRGRPPTGKALSSAERVRNHRAKRAAEQNGTGLIDELFPKGSPACDFDFEHGSQEGDDDGGAFMRARAVQWQMLEAERLAVECALLRDGTTSAEVKKLHISAALKVARHWVKLADQLRAQRRRL